MPTSTLGLLLGGILPLFLFGVAGFLQKASARAGIELGPYLLCAGVGVGLVAVALYWQKPVQAVSPLGALWAIALGIAWAGGMSLVALALSRYDVALAKLAPIYNTNTLVTMLLGLWLYAEWREVHLPNLAIGTVLILLGVAFVARS